MINLIIIDKHPVIRVAFELYFKDNPLVKLVRAFENVSDTFDYLSENEVDVVISEVDLPDLNGITALKAIKKTYPNIDVLMFSSQPEEVYALSTLKAGASGYISKSSNIDTVYNAILKVSKGETYLSDFMTKQLIHDDNKTNGTRRLKKLSSREIEVLKLLSIGKKNKQIATELDISEKTVSTYKTRLYKKMDVDNIVDLLHQTENLDLV